MTCVYFLAIVGFVTVILYEIIGTTFGISLSSLLRIHSKGNIQSKGQTLQPARCPFVFGKSVHHELDCVPEVSGAQ